jgi:hypothetical protein
MALESLGINNCCIGQTRQMYLLCTHTKVDGPLNPMPVPGGFLAKWTLVSRKVRQHKPDTKAQKGYKYHHRRAN